MLHFGAVFDRNNAETIKKGAETVEIGAETGATGDFIGPVGARLAGANPFV